MHYVFKLSLNDVYTFDSSPLNSLLLECRRLRLFNSVVESVGDCCILLSCYLAVLVNTCAYTAIYDGHH